MQNALKDIFRTLFETMLKDELNHRLDYDSNNKGEKKHHTEEIDTEKTVTPVLVKLKLLPRVIIIGHSSHNLFQSVKKTF